jgi:hypothetical protein
MVLLFYSIEDNRKIVYEEEEYASYLLIVYPHYAASSIMFPRPYYHYITLGMSFNNISFSWVGKLDLTFYILYD